jgi:Tfp pilus assembly protein PilF
MCRFYEHRSLPALAVLAALVLASPAVFAQTPVQTPVQTFVTATAPATQTQPSEAAPQNPPTSEQVGDALMSHQRYQAAIEAYKKGPRSSPDVWNKMGIAYQLMFNLQDASRCYQASLKLDPKNPSVLNNLGTIYDSLKQPSNAERMYRKAVKLDPSSALIFKNLGTNLLAQHKYKKGWEVYKTALTLDPHVFQNNASPRVENPATVQERGAMNFYMAKGCVRAGMNDRAIEYLRMALNEGFTSPKKIEADSEFAALRGIPAFVQLLAAQSQQ